MPFNQDQLTTLSQLAVEAARAAGKVINTYRSSELEVQHKAVGDSIVSQVVTEADHKAQDAILEILQPSLEEFGLAMLTEESPDDGSRHRCQAFWCVDPMDGTYAFIHDASGFSVSIGLVAQDGTPLIGVVYDPVEDDLYLAIKGQGAYKNNRSLKAPRLDFQRPLILRTDKSLKRDLRIDEIREGVESIAKQLGLAGAEIVYRVGAVMNACGILEDANIFYFKVPRVGDVGGSLWDYAATACLYNEAGAVASDVFGQAMELNRVGSTFMNHRGLLYASDAGLAQHVIEMNRGLSAHSQA